MYQHLPSNPSIEFYRKRAKALLAGLRTGDESAKTRFGDRRRKDPCLADAQAVVALEAGFPSWLALRKAVNETANKDQREPKTDVKQRYEGNASVQRWIKHHGEAGGLASGFLAEHRDRDWIISALGSFAAEGLIADVVGMVKSGKEANVYRCTAADGEGFRAAKIYRPRMFRNLQNDAVYRTHRVRRGDARAERAMAKMTPRGRSLRMEHWIRFEYDTLAELYAAGADVPKPYGVSGTAILMEFVGDAELAAPMLRHADPSSGEAKAVFQRLMENVETMLAAGTIHADLSPFNVLYWNARATIIDFAQAVDARSAPDTYELLRRDVRNVVDYFRRYGIEADADAIAHGMWQRHMHGETPQPAGLDEAGPWA
jgi:RIO kinase 1